MNWFDKLTTIFVRLLGIASVVMAAAILLGTKLDHDHLILCAGGILLWLSSEYGWKKESNAKQRAGQSKP
ncbi:hypothetical protein BX589_102395 [Paraburkholderia fungorum]|nr:hypothetical protein BX589_102395 [Paraburkholderia fungorum]